MASPVTLEIVVGDRSGFVSNGHLGSGHAGICMLSGFDFSLRIRKLSFYFADVASRKHEPRLKSA